MLTVLAHRPATWSPSLLTFPRAPRVQPGDAVASRQLAGLARSVKARMRSGLGDPTKRLAFYALGLFRQMRNPDASGNLWPAQHEYFTHLQFRDPDQYEWPVTGPGEPEGANVSSPLPAFIWGNEAAGFPGESDRLLSMPWTVDGHAPESEADVWRLGKLQRGGFDPRTGAVACPAWDAARSHTALRYSTYSPHATAYGGRIPTPELGSACADPDPDDDLPAPLNHLYQFTAVTESASTDGLHGTLSTDGDGRTVLAYSGSCWPYSPAGVLTHPEYLGHVAYIARTDYQYVVYLWDGTRDTLPANDWVEGPYTGAPRLSKTIGGQLDRALAQFVRGFRGAAQDAAATAALDGAPVAVKRWNDRAFDFHRFFTSQYLLAPARGRQLGEAIAVDYPTCRLTAPGTAPYRIAADTVLPWVIGDQSGTGYRVHDGCVAAGVFVRATGLAAAVWVFVGVDGEVLARMQLLPDGAGAAEALQYFRIPPAAGQRVQVWCSTSATFTSAAGKLEAELAELYAYQPDLNDAMLVMRVQGARA